MPVCKSIMPVEGAETENLYNIERDGLTQSLMNACLSCSRKGRLMANRWTGSGNGAMRIGSMVHEILDKSYTMIQKKKIIPSVSVIDRWIFEEKNKSGLGEYDVAKVAAICHNYFNVYSIDQKRYDIIEVEKTFDVNMDGIRLRGKRDMVLYEKKNGKLWLLDHKTKGQIDDDYIGLHLTLDSQMSYYSIAYYIENRKWMSGYYYNVIRMPQNKPGKNESVQDFYKKICEAIKEKPEYYFKRYEVSLSQKQFMHHHFNLGQKLKEVRRAMRGEVPMNENACCSPYKCEFLEACAGGTMMGYNKKEKLFTELE